MFNYTIISDKDNEERRAFVRKEFSNIGIDNPHFTDAIMAIRMSDEEAFSYATPNTYLTKGEIGCALSHKKAYKELLDSNQNSIVIFEDDAVFTKDFSVDILLKIIKIVDDMDVPVVVSLQENKQQKSKICSLSDTVSLYSMHKFGLTFGYIVNKKAAKSIIGIQTPIHFESDAFEYFYYLDGVKLFSVNKSLVFTSFVHDSTIGKRDDFPQRQKDKIRKSTYKMMLKKMPIRKQLLGECRHIYKGLHQWVKRNTK